MMPSITRKLPEENRGVIRVTHPVRLSAEAVHYDVTINMRFALAARKPGRPRYYITDGREPLGTIYERRGIFTSITSTAIWSPPVHHCAMRSTS
jgi:hypothetical protein